MNLRFVEAFHWAVALKSVTRAAEKLHITQSACPAALPAAGDVFVIEAPGGGGWGGVQHNRADEALEA